MSSSSKTTKKYLRYALTGVLVTGMVLVTGFLSFTGMLVLNSSIYMAMASFFLAGGIEGEVYAQQIGASLLKILTGGFLEDMLLQKKLNQLIKTLDDEHPSSPFLLDYKNQLEYVQRLENNQDSTDPEERKNAKKTLKWMRRHFKRFMLEGYPDQTLEALIPAHEREKLCREIRRKTWLSRLSWILNLGAGISCGLVGLEVAQSSLLTLTTHFGIVLSGAAMSASIAGLAIVGAIGYTFLIHNTITDMIQNDTLQKWARKTTAFFRPKPGETSFKYGSRIVLGALGVTLVVGMAVFATVATAGTWWFAAKAGAQMIPGIRNLASTLRNATVPLMGITTLAFNVVNSLESAKELTKISLHKTWHHFQNQVKTYKKEENSIQFWNPARLLIQVITIPFKAFTFIGHLISMGIMGDKLNGVDPLITTGISTTSEGLTDFHIIFPDDHNHSADHNHHDHPHHHHHDHAVKPHSHQHKQHHHHSHADLTGKFLKVALSPLYVLTAVWDYHFSQKNAEPEKRLSFKAALKKSFFGLPKAKKTNHEKPKLSIQWLLLEQQQRLEKTVRKYAGALEVNKENNPADQQAIQELRDLPLQKPHCHAQRPHYLELDGAINSNTFFESRPQPISQSAQKVCEKMIEKLNSPQYVRLRVSQ